MERRTVVKGAAWAAPVIVMASPAPAIAASETCLPTLSVQPGSYKCCGGGPRKTMFLRLLVTDGNACGIPTGSTLYITDVRLSNGQAIGRITGLNMQARLGEEFRLQLDDVSSCTVNLLIDVSVDSVIRTVELKSSNIPGGTATQCG